jgi:hypothetical protein
MSDYDGESFTDSLDEDLPSIQLDNLSYRHNGERAACRSLGISGWEFPRRLISVSGFVVYVEEISDHQEVFGENDVLEIICIPSSVKTICESCF